MIWIDNRPVTALGLRPSRWSGWLTGARGAHRVTGVPGAAGQLVGAQQAADPRLATLTCYAPLAAVTDQPALIAAVEAAFTGGIRTLRSLNRAGLATRALLQGAVQWDEVAGAPGMTVPSLLCTTQWLAVDGGSFAYPAPGPVLLSTARTALALGSMRSGGWLLVWGSSSPLTITYTPANGVGATTCVITGALATDGHWACELDTGDVWQVAADGTRTRAASVVGALPACDPAHSVGSTGPGITLSSGTGLLLAEPRYRI